MLKVFTIGHSTRKWRTFLALLRANGIKRVIDVRSIPRLRHNPQFNRETLAAKLRSARVSYVHLRKLGGLRHARRDSLNTGWRNVSFRGFADYLQTAEFEAGLQRLIKLAKRKKTALMCAEAVPWRCHRSLIADALIMSEKAQRQTQNVFSNLCTTEPITKVGRHGIVVLGLLMACVQAVVFFLPISDRAAALRIGLRRSAW